MCNGESNAPNEVAMVGEAVFEPHNARDCFNCNHTAPGKVLEHKDVNVAGDSMFEAQYEACNHTSPGTGGNAYIIQIRGKKTTKMMALSTMVATILHLEPMTEYPRPPRKDHWDPGSITLVRPVGCKLPLIGIYNRLPRPNPTGLSGWR